MICWINAHTQNGFTSVIILIIIIMIRNTFQSSELESNSAGS